MENQGRSGRPMADPFWSAINRMKVRQVLDTEDLVARARAALAGEDSEPGSDVFSAVGTGHIALVSEHTHYFSGFALLLPLPQAVAVAVKSSSSGKRQLTIDSMDQSGRDPDRCREVVDEVCREFAGDSEFEIAAVSSVLAAYPDAYRSALAVATGRAVVEATGQSVPRGEFLQRVRTSLERGTGIPQSMAYVVAADSPLQTDFVLIDTKTLEFLPVGKPGGDVLGWGLISVKEDPMKPAEFYVSRREQTKMLVKHLESHDMLLEGSLRDLEHRDLERGLAVTPSTLQPILRHLVSENRRVQRLLVAIRRGDWQMFGALLLMSHASLRNEWGSSGPEADFLVSEIEQRTTEGIFGGCLTGRSGCVLVVGRPYSVGRFIDEIEGLFSAEFDRPAHALII
jgi:galactokinase